MTALPLLLMAVSAASVLAESTVHYREQFEDGGEVLHTKLYLHFVTVLFVETVSTVTRYGSMNEWLNAVRELFLGVLSIRNE